MYYRVKTSQSDSVFCAMQNTDYKTVYQFIASLPKGEQSRNFSVTEGSKGSVLLWSEKAVRNIAKKDTWIVFDGFDIEIYDDKAFNKWFEACTANEKDLLFDDFRQLRLTFSAFSA